MSQRAFFFPQIFSCLTGCSVSFTRVPPLSNSESLRKGEFYLKHVHDAFISLGGIFLISY